MKPSALRKFLARVKKADEEETVKIRKGENAQKYFERALQQGLDAATSRRRFEFVMGKSRKFWEIWVKGSEVHQHWGRIGTKGQKKSWELITEKAAKAEAIKRANAKITKGYVEVETPADAEEPIMGSTRYDESRKKMQIYDGSSWVDAGWVKETATEPPVADGPRVFDFSLDKTFDE